MADPNPTTDPLLNLQKALSGPLAWALHSALHLNHPDDSSRSQTAWLNFKQRKVPIKPSTEPSWAGFALAGFELLSAEQLLERAEQHQQSGTVGDVKKGLEALTTEQGLDETFGLRGAPEGRTSKVGVVLCIELADGQRRALLPYGLAIPFVPGGCPPFPIDENWLANFKDDLTKEPIEYGRMAPQIFGRLPPEVSMQWVEDKTKWQEKIEEEDRIASKEATKKRQNAAKKARKLRKLQGPEAEGEAAKPATTVTAEDVD